LLNNLLAKMGGSRIIDIQASGQRMRQQAFKHTLKTGFHHRGAE